MTRRIALLGLSGVGKSTLVERLAEELPVLHLQASALIKAEQAYRAQNPDSSEVLRTGAVLSNQELMIAAFHRETANVILPVVFDGHSIIDGMDGLIKIPAAVFLSLNLDAICFLSAEPGTIFDRRKNDGTRPRPERDAATLAEHQRIARETARDIAGEIGCKFVEISHADLEQLEGIIRADCGKRIRETDEQSDE